MQNASVIEKLWREAESPVSVASIIDGKKCFFEKRTITEVINIICCHPEED
jgi:hypothetical protein